MRFTNSPLVVYRKISPNKTSPRNHKIDTITIHCMAGNLSIETCGNVFASSSRKASSNYGIGTDGRIALYVEEKDRSWASSNAKNDHRAVTIEVANDGGAPDWHVSDRAITSLIELVTDICKRNSIKKLVWSTNKTDRINHLHGCNMTVHRDFAAKACPGNYLYNLHSYIAEQVNERLGVKTAPTNTAITPESNPYKEPTTNIRKGTKGEGAKWVQWCLWRFGLLDKAGIDGVIGSESEFAILTAQKRLGLQVDGIVGEITRKTFKSVFNK